MTCDCRQQSLLKFPPYDPWETGAGCRNGDLHPTVSDRVEPFRPWSRSRPLTWWVDAIAAQLAHWLPAPPPFALPGAFRREPAELAILRVAHDAEEARPFDGDIYAFAIRKQIEPDLAWKECSSRSDFLRSRVWNYATTSTREHARSRQRLIAKQEWDDDYRERRQTKRIADGRVVPGRNEIVGSVSIGWATSGDVLKLGNGEQYKVTAVSHTTLKLDLPSKKHRQRRGPRDPVADREAGRSFLLSKQRRRDRGTR